MPTDTLPRMATEKKETVPVRLPTWLMAKVGLAASAEGESVPEYLTRVTAEALLRDLPKVGKAAEKSLADLRKIVKEQPDGAE